MELYPPSSDLQKIGHAFLKEVSPAKAEITAALRIMRGSRHRDGMWSERPAYRLQVLLNGWYNQRLPDAPVGRRKAPSIRSLGTGLVHIRLAKTVLNTRGPYAHCPGGASFFRRRSPVAPRQSDGLTVAPTRQATTSTQAISRPWAEN